MSVIQHPVWNKHSVQIVKNVTTESFLLLWIEICLEEKIVYAKIISKE